MIKDIFYIKKTGYCTINYFSYQPNQRDKAYSYGEHMGIDGLEWISNGAKYCLLFSGIEFSMVNIHADKIFVLYQSPEAKYPAPNNLVVYDDKANLLKVLSPPILPTGKEGAGFIQISTLGTLSEEEILVEKKLEVVVWEHERSMWVYHYFFNPETYEFTFYFRDRY